MLNIFLMEKQCILKYFPEGSTDLLVPQAVDEGVQHGGHHGVEHRGHLVQVLGVPGAGP